jgi:hypothetical protein
MLFQDLLLLMLLASGVYFIGVPLAKLVRTLIPKKRDPLAEAKERLEQARLEAEAARLNKEAEKLYEKMYTETLQEEDVEENQQEKRK